MSTLEALKASGWHGVEIRCQPCRTYTQLQFFSFGLTPEDTLRSLTPRFVCQRCKGRPRPQDVVAFYVDTPGHPRPASLARTPSAADPD